MWMNTDASGDKSMSEGSKSLIENHVALQNKYTDI